MRPKHIEGFCFVEGEMASMDDLRPGDLFKLLPNADPAKARGAQQGDALRYMALLSESLARAPLYRFHDIDAPSNWGGAQCSAEVVE